MIRNPQEQHLVVQFKSCRCPFKPFADVMKGGAIAVVVVTFHCRQSYIAIDVTTKKAPYRQRMKRCPPLVITHCIGSQSLFPVVAIVSDPPMSLLFPQGEGSKRKKGLGDAFPVSTCVPNCLAI